MGLGNQMFKGMVWSAVERLSVQVVSFGLGIILARLLTPTEYGTVGLLIVFITISQVFIDSGFSKALIQKQNRTQEDIYTAFWFNVLIAVVCYVILWFAAPFIASFYEIAELSKLLRVLALSLLFNSLFSIPQTLFLIDLNFKSIAKVNFLATMLSGIFAVYLAYVGYGAWALVMQTLAKTILMAIFMWFQLKWMPKFIFSKSSFLGLFAFGHKLLLTSLLGTISSNINSLLIAKYIGAKDLGFYTRGTQFCDTVYGTLSTIFDSVLLPALSKVQDQLDVLIRHTQNVIKTAALLVTPLFLGLAVLAEPIIRVLLTEKWLMAVPIMQILCIARMITIISGISINLLYVIGRTDLALRQQYVKIAVRVALLLAALPFGIVYIALAELLSTTVHFFINTHYPGKMMNYGAMKQIKDISPILMAGALMTIISYLMIQYLPISDLSKLLTVPIIGGMVYFIAIKLLKIPEYAILTNKIKTLIKR
ncbi:MAG: lipopolysaccharide biosynthesis protein [Sediminicola sp.]